jgi:hypothetical protein
LGKIENVFSPLQIDKAVGLWEQFKTIINTHYTVVV